MTTIEFSSKFEQLWRYNIFIMCGGYNADGESLYVVGDEMISCETVQQEVVKLPPPPEGFDPKDMTLHLECEDAARYEIKVYVVAHMLPEDKVVLNSPPFDCLIKVSRGRDVLYREIHKVNQWGGLSGYINL